MYDCCIFDLYGTLVDIHTDEDAPGLWEKLALFYGFYGARYTAGELREAYGRLTRELTAGREGLRRDAHEACPEIRIEEVFRRLFTDKGCPAHEALAVHAGQFFRVLSIEYVRLYEGVTETLAALRAAGKRVYLLSNAQRIFTAFEMELLRIAGYFDDIFISSDWDVKKPDPRFFRLLLDRHRIDPARAVMIGNDGACDIAGARQVGLATLYIHSNISPRETGVQADHCLDQMDMAAVRRILLEET